MAQMTGPMVSAPYVAIGAVQDVSARKTRMRQTPKTTGSTSPVVYWHTIAPNSPHRCCPEHQAMLSLGNWTIRRSDNGIRKGPDAALSRL